MFLDGADERAEALCDGHATPLDPDQADGFRAIVFFDNLMREANQGALNLGGGHDPPFLAQLGRSNSLQI
jgi:hypothetical protein